MNLKLEYEGVTLSIEADEERVIFPQQIDPLREYWQPGKFDPGTEAFALPPDFTKLTFLIQRESEIKAKQGQTDIQSRMASVLRLQFYQKTFEYMLEVFCLEKFPLADRAPGSSPRISSNWWVAMIAARYR